MNLAHTLPAPLSSFVVDIPAHTYYDFDVPEESTYPLKGVTYPVDYGHILGHTAEDNHELDLYVGNSTDGLFGVIKVSRGETIADEHKFYAALSPEELAGVLKELQPVLLDHLTLTQPELLQRIAAYKDKR